MKTHKRLSLLLVISMVVASLAPMASLAAPPAMPDLLAPDDDLLVTFPGSYASAAGLGNDWDPANLNTQASDDNGDGVWKFVTDAIPAGSYEFKATVGGTWDENYGLNGEPNGPNVPFTADGGTVHFYYDRGSGDNFVASRPDYLIPVVAGSFVSEIGGQDWSPDHLKTWMKDPDGDGVYAYTALGVPEGDWEYKVALDESWAVAYPADNRAFNVPAGGADVAFYYDQADNAVWEEVSAGVPDEDLVRDPIEAPIQDEVMYFVMTDRFDNGDPSNDEGAVPGGTLAETGFLADDKAFYHGGDLSGLQGKLDYLEDLGVTSLWLTPVLRNQATQPDSSTAFGIAAAYHGYWILDYENADPHLATNAELQAFIAAAHARGIKVFFDIVVNHTADVIDYAEGQNTYRSKADFPYRDANGDPFDDRDYVGTGTFPELDPAVSFPYTPIFPEPGDESAKNPAWLNNPIYYHNRGESTFAGENSLYGDFFGLDDTFTEHPDVVNGYTEILKNLVTTYDIDGYRLDTAKHVNIELWQELAPQVLAHAQSLGKDDFTMFGEVFDGDPAFLSRYTTEGQLPSVLDFGLHGRSQSFAVYGAATDQLRDFFFNDDYFTDADSNAYQLGNFISNHDIGRVGHDLRSALPSVQEAELVNRMKLGYGLIYFARGFPVVYYGDEQGFVGAGDKLGREDMMPSLVPEYNAYDLIGTDATTADANFDTAHPVYQALADLADLVQDHLALRRGAQIHRHSSDQAGIYAFSRIERAEQVEYVVALNNATQAKQAAFATYSPNTEFAAIYPAGGDGLTSDGDGVVTVEVPGLSFVVYRAASPLPASEAAPNVSFTQPTAGGEIFGRTEIAVSLDEDKLTEVTFAVKTASGDWEIIGTDTNAPYRVFYDVGGYAVGTNLTFRAIANDLNGHLSSASVSAVVGEGEVPVEGPKYAIIHYFREDGDYGDHTTGDFNDFWGLHLWGDAIDPSEITEWTSPKPFLGEDEYGRFAWIKLADPTQPVNFIIHRGNVKDGTDQDRSFHPTQDSPEIWTKQDDGGFYTLQAAAQGYVTIHYQRPAGDYGDYSSDDYNDFWGLHLWGDAIDPSEQTGWTTPRKPDGQDDYGVFFDILLQDPNQPVNFIVHKGDVKDPPDSPDRSFNPADTATIWLKQDDLEVYRQRGAAEDFAVLHYRRDAGDYGDYSSDNYNDFWGLHTWLGAEDPGWTTPRKPVSEDLFGVIFQVPLFEDAEQMGYILHRGDEKDPGPDQFLIFADKGYEVWQLQGADPEDPYILPVPQVGGGFAGNISEQSAYWVLDDTIAWAAADSSANSYALCYAPEGGLEATIDGVIGGECVELTPDAAGLPDDVKAKFPHLADLPALKISAADLDMVPEILKGQFAVSSVNAEGLSQDATGLQIPGVLDDLYIYGGQLGVGWEGATPVIRVWAPTAKSVNLHLFADSDPATTSTVLPMYFTPDSGVWTIKGEPGWKNQYYLYEVEVYVPSTGQVEYNMVTDPYSFSLSMNSARSQIVDLSDAELAPTGWSTLVKPWPVTPEEMSVYEIHMRDFSVNDPRVPESLKGTYLAFTIPNSHGVRHVKALAKTGLTHLHLLPAFDIATVNEDKGTWQSPSFQLLAGFPPDSEEQQALVEATRDVDAFNWGYDPWHYTAPEGSYSVDPDGSSRIWEFREMVQAINRMGLRVVMDVVYNHTNAAGQNPKSVLDRIVPGYYHRLNDRGQVETSTCCPNTATEHNMMEKLMIDSVLTWAKEYKVDAFRFDLMGHHMKRNMLKLRQELDGLTLETDGVDGKSIYLYGEGWNFGEVADNARGENATQLNMAGTGIGTFSDRLRDAVRGGGPFDSGQDLVRRQGFANGMYYDPNELNSGSEEEKATLLLLSDQIRVGLAGNLADYEFIDRSGNLVTGSQVDYNGQPAGYTQDPQENVIYISKHDNQTLYDINAYKLPMETDMADRVRAQQVGLSIVALGQGMHFFHAGSDLLRSKSMDRDSYDSGDWFNRLDFTYQDSAWGSGLPVARVNEDNWSIMQPFLANPALKPAPADIRTSAEQFMGWMVIRDKSALFSLETEEDIQARLAFHNTGPDQLPGLIVMSLSDLVEPDLDRRLEFIVVLFNANDEAQTITVPATMGMNLFLHPIQMQMADEVVKTSSFDRMTGTFTVPGRTTAVFVLPQSRFLGSIMQVPEADLVIQGSEVAVEASLANASETAMDLSSLVPLDPNVSYVPGSAYGGAVPVRRGAAVVALAHTGRVASGEWADFGFRVKVGSPIGTLQHSLFVSDGASDLGSVESNTLEIGPGGAWRQFLPAITAVR